LTRTPQTEKIESAARNAKNPWRRSRGKARPQIRRLATMAAARAILTTPERAAEVGGDGAPCDNLDLEVLAKALEGFRPYLLWVAGRELTGELKAKCGPSDLVQDTLCEAHRDLDAFHGRAASDLRGWLRRILLHNIRDVARSFEAGKRKHGLELSLDRDGAFNLTDPAPTPGATLMAREETAAVAAALARLSDLDRRVIELRNRDRRSFSEIGAILGRSSDAARMLWYRAVNRLKRELALSDEL
jgi:RNA polymerase sigma-70 factor, ECF subfamily